MWGWSSWQDLRIPACCCFGEAEDRLSGTGMKFIVTAALIAGLGLTLTACTESVAGSCSTGEDVAAKITRLTDDLKKAQASGKIDAIKAGEIGAEMLEAGAKFGSERDQHDYCDALDKIRKSSSF
jgi:hypothetical protein